MLTGLAFRREHSLPPVGDGSGGGSAGTLPELGRRRSRAEQVRRLSCGSRGSPRLRRKRMTPSPDVTGRWRREGEPVTESGGGGRG